MTSVQNLQQQLSGSNLLILLIALFCFGCSPKRLTKSPAEEVLEKKTTVYNPRSGKEEILDESDKRDTVYFNRDDADPIIVESEVVSEIVDYRDFKKSKYSVAFLAPFNSRSLDTVNFEHGKDMYHMHYYEGLKIAAQSRLDEGMGLRLDVIDLNNSSVNNLVTTGRLKTYDIIIGGDSRSDIESLRSYAKKQKINYLSPWRNVRLREPNEYYTQLRPGILEQFDFIAQTVYENHSPSRVFIVVEAGDENRIRPFDRYADANKYDHLEQLVITDETFDLEETDVESMLLRNEENVFVVPYSSGTFFRKFLQKLRGSISERDVIVYGLHNWLVNDRIEKDYYENLNIRLASWYKPNYNTEDYAKLVDAYFAKNGLLLQSHEMVEGYDHMNFITEMLENYGTYSKAYTSKGSYEGLFYNFQIQEVVKSEETSYYENRYLRLVSLKEGMFEFVD